MGVGRQPIEGGSGDVQMDNLFRHYKPNKSITYDKDVPNGTRVLVVPDIQLPFVDEPLLKAFLKFTKDFKPDTIITVGDFLDAYEVSDFDKRPERMFNLQDEIEMGVGIIDDLHKRAAKNHELFWIDGNHEERVQRIIWRKAQQFSHLVQDLSEAMSLDAITDGHVRYGRHVDYLGFVITHGTVVRQHSAYTAKCMIDRYRSSGASGHTHRIGSHSVTDHRGVSHTWYEVGCLCRKDMEYAKAEPNWQQGFLIGYVWNNALHPQLIRVVEHGGQRGFMALGTYYEISEA